MCQITDYRYSTCIAKQGAIFKDSVYVNVDVSFIPSELSTSVMASAAIITPSGAAEYYSDAYVVSSTQKTFSIFIPLDTIGTYNLVGVHIRTAPNTTALCDTASTQTGCNILVFDSGLTGTEMFGGGIIVGLSAVYLLLKEFKLLEKIKVNI